MSNVRPLPQPRTPPYAIESEQSVLGALLLKNSLYHEVNAVLGPEDFYRHDHQVIYAAIGEMIRAGTACDFVTLTEHLRLYGKLEDAGGVSYLGGLANDTPSAANAMVYAETVADRAKRRRVISACGDIMDEAYRSPDSAEDLLSSVSLRLQGLLETKSSTSYRFQEAVRRTELYIQRIQERRRTGRAFGAMTGLASFDRLLGGFTGPRLYYVAARPKCGKSAFLNQFAVHAACDGFAGLLMSRELSLEELVIRAAALRGQQNVTKLLRGYEKEWDFALEKLLATGDIPLYIDEDTVTLEQVCAQATLHKAKHNIKWVAVDHLGLISTRQKFNNQNDKIGFISWSLKELAKRLRIPVIVLCQLSRKCDAENRRPRPDDTRDSGNIEQDADAIIMLHVPLKERDEKIKRVQLGIPANRTGPGIWLEGAEFRFNGATQTFSEEVPQQQADE